MIKTRFGTALVTLFGMLLCLRVDATALSFTGTLPTDDAIQTFTFALSAPGSVTIQTWSYAGGSNAAGAPVPQGGFDPGIALFDDLGILLVQQDDAAPGDVPADPVTNEQFDIYLVTALAAGTYSVAITQFDNVAIGPNLASGFSKAGAGSFTAAFGCTNLQFCDVDAVNRTGSWAADVTGTTVVPLPGTIWLLSGALGLFSATARRLGRSRGRLIR